MAFIHENIILPLSDILSGESVHMHLKDLRKAEQWSASQLHDYQKAKVKQLLTYVATEVPFYKDWFHDHNINPAEITLEQMPIVSKDLMRQEGIGRFTAEHFPINQRIASRSSGSTGEPFSFYVSREAYSVNTAAKLRTWYQAGYRLGDRYMKIANGARHGKLKKIQDRVNNCLYVPFYSVDDDALRAILDLIDCQQPKFIRSYPMPLFLLARYRNTHAGYSCVPKHIMTTGSTLPDAYRQEIEHAFGCDVIDSYSCEGVPNTYETPVHNGYQVCGYYGIAEVLDGDGRPVNDGVGRVVGTDLWNLAHPFLRYDTQDLVEVRGGRIIRIMGRECESLVDTGGRRYTVHNFVGFFQEDNRPTRQSVDAYQVVRRRDGGITFRLVVNNQYSKTIERYIVDYWQEQFGKPVGIELVDSIPLMHNNKRLTIVDEE